jgi:hypothetical protein
MSSVRDPVATAQPARRGGRAVPISDARTCSLPAREWSRGDARDIDGQTDRSNERERMSQYLRSGADCGLRNLIRPCTSRAHGSHQPEC